MSLFQNILPLYSINLISCFSAVIPLAVLPDLFYLSTGCCLLCFSYVLQLSPLHYHNNLLSLVLAFNCLMMDASLDLRYPYILRILVWYSSPALQLLWLILDISIFVLVAY